MIPMHRFAIVALMATGFAVRPAAGMRFPRHVPGDTAATIRFEVNGLSVILRRNTANDVVAANLYLLGGARQLTESTAGIEAMLLAVSERYPDLKANQNFLSLQSQLEGTENRIAVARRDYIEAVDVAIVRDQLVSLARERRTQPDDAATELADSLLYRDHPYLIPPAGSEASLTSITVTQMKQYHAQQLVTSRMLLIVVGNVDRAQIEKLVRQSIGTLPRGSYKWSTPPPPTTSGTALALDNRALPTNYLLGYAAGPPATDSDYTALRVATAVLSGRLFTEVRSRRNLSYAVEAPFLERAHAVGGLYVTTVAPNEVLRLMRQELNALQNETVDPAGLKRLEQQFITEYYLKNETNADQANALAKAELYQGDYRAADRFMESLRRVTPEDVRRAARQYLRNFQFAYVGDSSKLDRSLLQQF